jgi:SHS2 domain-containing protein
VPWRVLDHTADAGLVVEAAGWRELLQESARAFGMYLSSGSELGAHETWRPLEVRGSDRVETWVHHWRALHRLWTVEGFLSAHAKLDVAEEGCVRGTVGCVSAGALDLAHCVDVKAVTWHAAKVEHGADGTWVGTIVFDL